MHHLQQPRKAEVDCDIIKGYATNLTKRYIGESLLTITTKLIQRSITANLTQRGITTNLTYKSLITYLTQKVIITKLTQRGKTIIHKKGYNI